MSSLLDHLDNNYSDGDEDDHINRLFPKCKPRASSLQPFPSNSTNESSSLSSESRTSLSDCNLTNNDVVAPPHKNNINSVNNNSSSTHKQRSISQKAPENNCVLRNGHLNNHQENDNYRCLTNGGGLKAENNTNTKISRNLYPSTSSSSLTTLKKVKSERNSRSRRNHHHHHHHQQQQQQQHQNYTEFLGLKGSHLNPSVLVNNKRNNSHGRIMECDTLEDHFDNGIGSGGSSGSNGSAFSHSSSLSSTGEKTNVLSVSSSGLGSSGGNVGLRDSRIEIAGGREIFSQNRIKAGRRVRGSTSMDSMIVPQNNPEHGPHHVLTPSSSQSQLLLQNSSKGRRKTNPLISPSSPVHNNPSNNIWEPNLVPLVSKRNFPFSSSSSSSSRGGGDRERDRIFESSLSSSNPRGGINTNHSGGNNYYRRSSQYYPQSSSDYDIMKKSSPSREGNNLPQVHNSLKSPTTTIANTGGSLVMKETVFSTEITSIEKPVEVGKTQVKEPPPPAPFIYETPIDGGEIVFDDIEEQHHWAEEGKSPDHNKESSTKFISPNVVEKSQLNFLDTFIMRDNVVEEGENEQLLLQQQQQTKVGGGNFSGAKTHSSSNSKGIHTNIVSNMISPGGYDSDECASSSVLATNNNSIRTSPNGNKRLIGSIPIAEYEGSPKRYGLRLPTQAKPNHLELVDPNSPSMSTHLSVSTTQTTLSPRLSPSSSSAFSGSRLPGFPLRIDTSTGIFPQGSGGGGPGKESRENRSERSERLFTSESPPSPGLAILMESNDHNLDLDGSLNSKLEGTFCSGTFSGNNIPTTGLSPTCSVHSGGLGLGQGGSGGLMGKTGNSTDMGSDDSVVSQQGSNLTTANSLEDAETEVLGNHHHHPHHHLVLEGMESQDDYLLYEFSETRKVLEEFFKPVSSTGSVGGGGERLGSFDELDYTLKRQAGNSYVGQRLASESSANERNVAEESPKKPPRRSVTLNISSGGGASPKLISFQEVSLPLSHNSHSQSSISPSSSMAAAAAAASTNTTLQLLDSSRDVNDNDIDVETASTNTETDLGDTEVGLQVGHSRNFTLSPETTDCDSNELESEISLDFEASLHSSSRIGAIMPVLEDGLSSGNVSDNEDRDEDEVSLERKRSAIISRKISSKNLSTSAAAVAAAAAAAASGLPLQQVMTGSSTDPNPTLLLMKKQISEIEKEIKLRSQRVVSHSESNGSSSNNNVGSSTNGPGPSPLRIPDSTNSGAVILPPSSSNLDKQPNDMNSQEDNFPLKDVIRPESNIFDCNDPELEALDPMRPTPPPSPAPSSIPHHLQQQQQTQQPQQQPLHHLNPGSSSQSGIQLPGRMVNFTCRSPNEGINNMCSNPNPSHNNPTKNNNNSNTHQGDPPNGSTSNNFSGSALNNSSLGLLHETTNILSEDSNSAGGADIEQSIQDAVALAKNLPSQRSSTFDGSSSAPSVAGGTTNISMATSTSSSSQPPPPHSTSEERLVPLARDSSPVWVPRHPASTSGNHHPHRSVNAGVRDPLLRKQRYEETPDDDADTDQETDRLLGQNRTEDDYGFYDEKEKDGVKKKRSKEDFMNNPSVLIEGVLFRARYLGSTQLVCEGQPTKATRMMQAEEAVSRIKAQANQNGSVCQLASSSSSSSSPPPPTSSLPTSIEPPSVKALTSPYKTVSSSEATTTTKNYTDFLYKKSCSRRRSSEDGVVVDVGVGLEEVPNRDEDSDEDEDSVEDDDDEDDNNYFRQQLNPVAALGESLLVVDNNLLVNQGAASSSSPANSAHSGSGRRLSSSDLTLTGGIAFNSSTTTNLPGSNGSSVGGSLPHLSPPCGSALPGTMFRLRFVGSLEVEEEIGSGRRRRKRPKKTMVEEAVLKLKAPEGETQPSTEVDLFISTEKIMVLNTDLKEIMMDHALRTISYIADIGDLVVLMARRRPVPTDTTDESKIPRPPKMICHVFESDEAQYIAQSIGQAFQVAYMEFLKANGIEDHSFVREMDYQEVLNSQEIFGDELQMFAKKELQKEVVVPKTKGEILGVVIVESGWGSMLPTVVIANLAPAGAAARCGQLNIGDQIIAINGVSLVGLPLSTCQNYIKNTKAQTVVKLTVVPCPPVVEVKIKRPDTKYQLGFSVQNGVICSLLRGGIAERGGVRVGHRIIEINNQSVVAVPHEKIVNLLATSVGEINMKTMPTSMFRLLTGQETPLYI